MATAARRGAADGAAPGSGSRRTDDLGPARRETVRDGGVMTGQHDSGRRLHLVNVSLPKTGTQSVAGLFGRFRTAHEFWLPQAAEILDAERLGHFSESRRRRFVLERDAAGKLEVDSASFNHWFADILVDAFPAARFLLVVREPAGWLESWLGEICFDYRLRGLEEIPYRPGVLERMLPGPFDTHAMGRRERLVAILPDLADSLLAHWSDAHRRLLDILPPDRWLLLRLDQLSASLPALAAFAGIAADRLDRSAMHLHRRPAVRPLLPELGPDRIAALVERRCGPLWRELLARTGAGDQPS